jgi:hypothetical protein
MKPSMSPLEQAERRHRQGVALRSMMATLRAFLEGRLSRAEVKAWTRTMWPENGGQGSPTERDRDGSELIREADICGYLHWLETDREYDGDRDPLVGLPPGIDALAVKTGSTPIRYWLGGVGWYFELCFRAPTTGRPFVAIVTAQHEHQPIAVHTRPG